MEIKVNKLVKVNVLNLAQRNELFNLHAMYVDPEASESRFNKKSVRVEKINPQLLSDDDLYGHLSPEQLESYGNLLKTEGFQYAVFSGSHLIDGLHRLTAAKKLGLESLDVLDFGDLLAPEESGYSLKTTFLPKSSPPKFKM